MAELLVQSDSLKAVANAIRSKGGTSANLSFPEGFVNAIAALATGGGSLPSGISKIASGRISSSSDIVSIDVTHGLGTTPNFCLWMLDDVDYTSSTDTGLVIMGASFNKSLKQSSSSSTVYPMHYMLRGYNSSGTLGGTTSNGSTYMNSTQFTLLGTSTYKCKAGKYYRWVCGVMDF